MSLRAQLVALFVLAIPVACVAWTVTHEEVFREPREYCVSKSQKCLRWYERKFFYLFTCEYCFSHYVALAFIAISRYQLLFTGWRGYLVAWLALVWIANQYMSIYNRLRLDIKGEKIEHELKEEIIEKERTNQRDGGGGGDSRATAGDAPRKRAGEAARSGD
jgi:hypothetical protein